MLEIQNISKKFGKKEVLKSLSFKVDNGTVYSLLGKNGVGKSTLINVVIDLIKPDEGEIFINNNPHNKLNTIDKKNIGVVGEELALIEEISGSDYLFFIGRLYKLPSSKIKNRIDDLVKYFFEDNNDLKKSISKYSTGMKKKLAFCAAVLHTPNILILDEPFSGLDPLVANQMIEFLNIYRNKNRVILISSHDLSYVEKIATHIGVLDNGILQFNSTLKDFTENGTNTLDSALLKVIKPNETKLQKIDWI